MLASGKTAQAEKILRDAVAKSPNSAELHAQLGMLLFQLKKHPEAIEELGRAVQLDESNSEYAMNLADALLAARRLSVVAEFLTAVKARFEKLPAHQYKLGLAHSGARNFAGALDRFHNALELAPRPPVCSQNQIASMPSVILGKCIGVPQHGSTTRGTQEQAQSSWERRAS